ncbi:Nucleotidyltransferase [Atractiella rhizophila]|nr:Nucleotidyltransferase [Atractiella rhizophila]
MSKKRRPSPSSSSTSTLNPPRKRLSHPGVLLPTIYIIDSKLLPEEIEGYISGWEAMGGRVLSSVEGAEVVVTRLRSLKRIARSLEQGKKTVVSDRWLLDAFESSENALPNIQDYLIASPQHTLLSALTDGSGTDGSGIDGGSDGERKPPRPPVDRFKSEASSIAIGQVIKRKNLASSSLKEEVQPRLRWERGKPFPVLSCRRPTPLLPPSENIPLLSLLSVIRKRRWLEGEETSALAYSRAISALKFLDFPIKIMKDVDGVSGIGGKIGALVKEWIESGTIAEAESIRRSTRFQALSQFVKVHGIGPGKAKELYAKGCRTIEDVSAKGGFSIEFLEENEVPMLRVEIERFVEIIGEHIKSVAPEAAWIVAGSYRRGQPTSQDIDILVTVPKLGEEKGLLKKILDTLHRNGLLEETLYLCETDSKRPIDARHYHASGVDPFDKAYTVLRQPFPAMVQGSKWSGRTGVRRRVDFIICPIKYFWTGVLGWTGSTMFERDLRLWGKKKNMKFDSGGLYRRSDSKEILVNSEEEIFEKMGLEYIPPTLRNCDFWDPKRES